MARAVLTVAMLMLTLIASDRPTDRSHRSNWYETAYQDWPMHKTAKIGQPSRDRVREPAWRDNSPPHDRQDNFLILRPPAVSPLTAILRPLLVLTYLAAPIIALLGLALRFTDSTTSTSSGVASTGFVTGTGSTFGQIFVVGGGAPVPGVITSPDGTLTAPDGTVTAPDGTVTAPDGTVTAPDGSVILPDAGVVSPDGSVTAPDGSVTTVTGVVISPDGTITFPDDTVVSPDGTVTAPDGSITLPDGSVVDVSGVSITADGTVTAPDGTVYYANGTVVEAADEQVTTTTEVPTTTEEPTTTPEPCVTTCVGTVTVSTTSTSTTTETAIAVSHLVFFCMAINLIYLKSSLTELSKSLF